MARIYHTKKDQELNERRKRHFVEFYDKKPQEEPKHHHISTKSAKIADLTEKPVKSDDFNFVEQFFSNSKYTKEEAIQRCKDWSKLTDSIRIDKQSIGEYVATATEIKQTKTPVSIPNPNQAFKYKNIPKNMISLSKPFIISPNNDEEYDLPEEDDDIEEDYSML